MPQCGPSVYCVLSYCRYRNTGANDSLNAAEPEKVELSDVLKLAKQTRYGHRCSIKERARLWGFLRSRLFKKPGNCFSFHPKSLTVHVWGVGSISQSRTKAPYVSMFVKWQTPNPWNYDRERYCSCCTFNIEHRVKFIFDWAIQNVPCRSFIYLLQTN